YSFFCYFYLNSENRNKELIAKSIHLDMLENNIRFVNELQQIYEQNRRLNHDMKNHLVTIKGNIEDDNKKEALAYIDNLYDRIITIPMVNTKNEVFNYITNSKVSIMQEAFIEFYYNITDSLGFMDAVDISSILGNLLDNAIEAQKYVTGKKYIYLTTIRKGNMVFLEVKNSCNKESINMSQGTLLTRKKDSFNHGLGLENARSHLHKYNGDLEVIIEDDVFIVKVMMLL
ncbi:MAG: GHKL domain-containing protein, partial [Erysipelotrichaceae bacterium]|nr:GHKL domain-containing protein [Erysipelotrichaceae bacterium]